MRLYLKLCVMIALFVCAANVRVGRVLGEITYDARVALVCAFGSDADRQALIDDTGFVLAREQGNLDIHLRGQRYRQLLEQRRAEAERSGGKLTDEQYMAIQQQCVREAFGPEAGAASARPGRTSQELSRPLIVRRSRIRQ